MTIALRDATAGLPAAAVAEVDLARTPLPPPLRPDAELAVLDVTEFYGATSGGVRTYLEQKAAYVGARARLRQVVVVPGAHDLLDDRDGTRWYRLRGPRVPMRPPYRFMLATRQGRRIVEHERPDIIEIGSPGLVPWIVHRAARRTHTPLVYFYHSHFPALLGRAVERLAWRYARRLDTLFATTIVASDYAASALRAAGIDRTVRVPLGVDLRVFTPLRRQAAPLARARTGLPAGPLGIYVGRLAPEKRLDVLVRAWREVRRHTGARLVIVGEGSDERRLRALPGGEEVLWRPFEADRVRLAELIAAADLCLAPGPVETFGLAALEAMACGVPVLAASAGAVAELVTRSGGGALFEAGSIGGLRDSAIALLRAGPPELRALGMLARQHAEREHGSTTVFGRLFAVYRDVLRDWRG